MTKLSIIDWIAVILVIVGGVNWGLVGLFNLDLVSEVFGGESGFDTVIYVVISLASLWMIYTVSKMAGGSSPEGAGPGDMSQGSGM